MDNEAETAYAEFLRKELKEQGLMHAIQRMSVEDRGTARRLIRTALETQIKWRRGELT